VDLANTNEAKKVPASRGPVDSALSFLLRSILCSNFFGQINAVKELGTSVSS